jgi:hypothetical protein
VIRERGGERDREREKYEGERGVEGLKRRCKKASKVD